MLNNLHQTKQELWMKIINMWNVRIKCGIWLDHSYIKKHCKRHNVCWGDEHTNNVCIKWKHIKQCVLQRCKHTRQSMVITIKDSVNKHKWLTRKSTLIYDHQVIGHHSIMIWQYPFTMKCMRMLAVHAWQHRQDMIQHR